MLQLQGQQQSQPPQILPPPTPAPSAACARQNGVRSALRPLLPRRRTQRLQAQGAQDAHWQGAPFSFAGKPVALLRLWLLRLRMMSPQGRCRRPVLPAGAADMFVPQGAAGAHWLVALAARSPADSSSDWRLCSRWRWHWRCRCDCLPAVRRARTLLRARSSRPQERCQHCLPRAALPPRVPLSMRPVRLRTASGRRIRQRTRRAAAAAAAPRRRHGQAQSSRSPWRRTELESGDDDWREVWWCALRCAVVSS